MEEVFAMEISTISIEKAIEMALEQGFDTAASIDPSKLWFRQEVRDMCAECRSYNTRWTCPPACGTLEEATARVIPYSRGILVQTICRMENEFDYEAWGSTSRKHGDNFLVLTQKLDEMGIDIMALGAGGCRRCDSCTYPDEPCRFPDLARPSMEACGLMVGDVCKDNGITYYYGRNTVAYNCCILFK